MANIYSTNFGPNLGVKVIFFVVAIYRKIPIISPGRIFVQSFLPGIIFGRAYFLRSSLLEGILRFKVGWT